MKRHHILFIALLLTLVLTVGARAAEFAGGTGTADDPYQIATPAQLIAIGQDPNLQDKHFVLIADLDMDPNLPDGQLLQSSLILTTGSFDGAGHTIKNLGGRIWIEGGRAGYSYGEVLFKSIGSEAVVQDLIIEGQFYQASAMFAEENAGTIIDCCATGSLSDIVTAEERLYDVVHGGLVETNSGAIIGCSVVAEVIHGSGVARQNSGTIAACHVTGNVVGSAGLVETNEGTIRDCYALGDVQSLEGDTGGLVGTNSGIVCSCYALGDVQSSVGAAGGLVGVNSEIICGCYALGNVQSIGGEAGGLVGANSGIIGGCYTLGDVQSSAGDVGGLVGINEGTIRGCYAPGEARSLRAEAGGLVGSNSGSISHCFASGYVTAKYEAGGLVGVNSGTVSYCYATGDVLSEYEDDYHRTVAGLVASNEGTISYCYATGAGGMGLVGDNSDEAIVEGCFALSPRDGGGENNYLCVLLGDAYMRRQESFVGWDFADTISDGTLDEWMLPPDGGYPVLTMVDASAMAGNGTADDPYLIETYPQFMAMFHAPEAYYQLTTDIDLQGSSFSLPPIPIFMGHLYGEGHSISNFTLTGGRDVGLFGLVYPRAVVSGLHLRQVRTVCADDDARAYSSNIGTLVACNRGTVVGCSAVAETSIQMGGSYENIGGLVGTNDGGQLLRCSVQWSLTMATYADGCGGLVGRNSGTVTQCHACTYANGVYTSIGSLIGYNDGDVADCYASGHLAGGYIYRSLLYPTRSLGGLIGTHHGTVTNCYAVTGQASLAAGGGLVGEDPNGSVLGCYFLAEADGGGPDNGFGTALSEAQMRQRGSFAGWDFENVWTICEDADYPRLQWEGIVCGQ